MSDPGGTGIHLLDSNASSLPARNGSPIGVRKRRGRPSKLTPDVWTGIIDDLRKGNYLETCGKRHGIGTSTLYTWLNRGESEQKGFYHDFLKACEAAIADAEAKNVQRLDDAAASQPQWAAHLLERRWPERWGRKLVEVRSEAELTIRVDEEDVRERLFKRVSAIGVKTLSAGVEEENRTIEAIPLNDASAELPPKPEGENG